MINRSLSIVGIQKDINSFGNVANVRLEMKYWEKEGVKYLEIAISEKPLLKKQKTIVILFQDSPSYLLLLIIMLPIYAILIYFAIMIQSLKTHRELQNQNMWDRRKELRQLDEVTLSLLQYEFEHFRQESTNNVTLIDALAVAVMTKELIIERLEESIGMALPYWDYRMDTQLAEPKDSSIMLMELCQHVNESNDNLLMNSTEEETDRQLLKIEQRCKSGALLTFLRQTLPPDNSEFLKISKSSASIIALTKGCSLCETNNSKRWLFCDRNTHLCVSKIIPNGDCTKFQNNSESCFQSKCDQGRCSQQEMTTIMKVSENTTIARNSASYLKNSLLPPKAVLLTRNFTSDINSNHIRRTDVQNAKNSSISHWVISEGKYQILDFMPIELSKFKGSTENSSYDKKEIILPIKRNRNRKKVKKHSGGFRNKGEAEINKTSPKKYPESIHFVQSDNNTFPTKKRSKYDDSHRKFKQQEAVSKVRKGIIHLYGFDRPSSSEELLKSLKIGPDFGKVPEFGMKDAKIPVQAEEQYKTTTVSVPSQYVYFFITVIKGKSKRNNLLNRAVDVCDITLSGANMPYGFTESIKGQLIQNKTSAVLRTLNPEMFGPLVEFYITVTDQDGRLCQQKCLNTKGTYGNCEERPIRLSSHEFIVFSDPIEFHEKSSLNVV
uniref:Bm9877 n=1 Tax=Brugia malayi TaxID=6279 RepID=A0A0I9R2Z0_BRUMA|nr:Bm9877 [Brugia malayi]